MSRHRNVGFRSCLGDAAHSDMTIWPVTYSSEHKELLNRMTVVLYTGTATIHLRPTPAEARALIDALQWALDAVEAPA